MHLYHYTLSQPNRNAILFDYFEWKQLAWDDFEITMHLDNGRVV